MADDSADFDLLSSLPAPHDEEPAALRQDILDELADHLACSLQREQVRTPDVRQARFNVLQRFGNPASIARKLWWDAMWEKIMTQRLMLAACLGMLLVSTGMAVVMWQALDSSRAAQSALLERQQEFFDAMLAKLEPRSSSQNAREGWAPLDVQLVDPSGQPVSGLVTVTAHKKGDLGTLQDQTNKQGTIGFGMLPWGQYDLIVFLKSLNVQHRHTVFLRPGNSVPEKIVCPAAVPVSTLQFDVHPPESTRRAPIALICEVFPGNFQIDESSWEVAGDPVTRVLLNGQGQPIGKVASRTGTDVNGELAKQIEVEAGPVQIIGDQVAVGMQAWRILSGPEAKSVVLAMNDVRQVAPPSLQNLKADPATREITVALPAESPTWSALQVQLPIPVPMVSPQQKTRTHVLTFVDEQQQPVQGVKVTFRGQKHSSFLYSQPAQTSDAAGQVEFSLHAEETTYVQFILPTGESSAFLMFALDSPRERTIVVPSFQPPQQALTFDFIVPDGQTPSDWLFDLEIERLPVTVDGLAWTAPEKAGESETMLPHTFRLLVKGDGRGIGRILGDQPVSFSPAVELKLQEVSQFPDGEYALRAMRICQEQKDQMLNPEGDMTVIFLTRMAKTVEGTSGGRWRAGGQGNWPIEVPRLLAERAWHDAKDE